MAVAVGASSYLKSIKFALIANKQGVIDLGQYYIELIEDFNTSWRFKLFDNLDAAIG